MGYMKIENLYKNKDILMFKECYALEKIHGTSAHISYKDNNLHYFSGGAKYSEFAKLLDHLELNEQFISQGFLEKGIVVFGEAYGGKMQGMSDTYGKTLKFVVFDIKVGDTWLGVEDAHKLSTNLGLDFVSYNRILTDLDLIDIERDKPSAQAVKNGILDPKMREGIILRPIIELRDNRGNRIISKHKRNEFRETKTPRVVSDEELKVLVDAQEIAEEWVTYERLRHVLDANKLTGKPENFGIIIKKMVEDIEIEGAKEIVITKAARKTIGKKTVVLLQTVTI